MDWIDVMGWIVSVIVFMAGAGFAFVSAKEGEWRAVRRTIPLVFMFTLIMVFLLLLEFPGRRIILTAVTAAMVCTAILFLLPLGRVSELDVSEVGERADERDAIFHRFYRLSPESTEFTAYYRQHPEKREFDRSVRYLPQLGFPGGRTYHPLNSPYHTAIFDILERLTCWDDGDEDHVLKKVDCHPDEITRRIKGFARFLGADLIGTTRLNQAHVYSHIGRSPGPWGEPIVLDHTYAIAIAVEMREEMIRHAPAGPVITETAYAYFETARIATIIARYIQNLGYEARAHVDGNYRVLCVPVAVDAGLGELGRLGLLITPEFGPRVRLSVVTTDLPLAVSRRRVFGVQEFCTLCRKCAENCPSQSIKSGSKKNVRGVTKWQSDQESCYRFWRVQGTDCSVCIRVCPYSHPASLFHNLIRFAISRNQWARRLALWADDYLYGRRPSQAHTPPTWHGSS